jgi:hypothetical protein
MALDHRGHCGGVDLAQVVVDQYVAKTADLAPRYLWLLGFQSIGQLLCGLRQGLQVSQRGIKQNLICGQITPGLYLPDPRDGVEDMQGVGLPRLAHISITSRITCSRMCRFNSCSGITSTERCSNSASWSVSGRRWANMS